MHLQSTITLAYLFTQIRFNPDTVAPISPYLSFSEVGPQFCKCIDWREAPNNNNGVQTMSLAYIHRVVQQKATEVYNKLG